MAAGNFIRIMDEILRHEDGYVDRTAMVSRKINATEHRRSVGRPRRQLDRL